MIPAPSFPPPVHPGDRVGVAALSGWVDPGRLEAGVAALAALGYEPVEADNLRCRCGLFAGSDDERLDAFHALAADDSLGAIVFARGGSGSLRILPRLDWELLARRPRAYVGYSDLTPFLLEVVTRLGLVAFHGPMVAADLARGLRAEERESFAAALAGRLPATLPVRCAIEPSGGGEPPDDRPSEPAEGPLLGGCLSLLVSTLGTPHAPDLDGAILFLEDVGEPVYRFDRMLTHLRLSGNLARLKGLVAGHLQGDPGELPPVASTEALLAQLRDQASGFPWPLATGLPAGHSRPNLTLPLGAWARLEPAAGRLVIDRAAPGDAGAR